MAHVRDNGKDATRGNPVVKEAYSGPKRYVDDEPKQTTKISQFETEAHSVYEDIAELASAVDNLLLQLRPVLDMNQADRPEPSCEEKAIEPNSAFLGFTRNVSRRVLEQTKTIRRLQEALTI